MGYRYLKYYVDNFVGNWDQQRGPGGGVQQGKMHRVQEYGMPANILAKGPSSTNRRVGTIFAP